LFINLFVWSFTRSLVHFVHYATLRLLNKLCNPVYVKLVVSSDSSLISAHEKDRLCKNTDYMNLHFKVNELYFKYAADVPPNKGQIPEYTM